MPFVLACGQFVPHPGNVDANLTIMEQQIAEARSRGATLIVFPELAVSGYLPPDEIPPLALRADSAEIGRLCQAAIAGDMDIAFGFAEKEPDGSMRNSMAYLNSRGQIIHTYHKVHLWDTERQWAQPGDRFRAFDTGQVRAGMWICYDTRFPEVGRLLTIDGASLGLAATAWLGPADEWELAVRARAMDNGMYVAGSAIQGSYGPFKFNGGSLIVDPHGKVLAEGKEGEDEVIVAGYEEEVVYGFRNRIPLLEHRAIAAYQPLLKPASW